MTVSTSLTIGKEEIGVLTEISLKAPVARKQGRNMRIYFCVCAAVLLVLFLLSGKAFFGILGAVFLLFALFGIRPFQRFSIRSAYRKLDSRAFEDTRQYEFDESGARITTPATEARFEWSAFTAWGEDSHYLWAIRADNHTVLVDVNRLSESDAVTLRGFFGKIGPQTEK